MTQETAEHIGNGRILAAISQRGLDARVGDGDYVPAGGSDIEHAARDGGRSERIGGAAGGWNIFDPANPLGVARTDVQRMQTSEPGVQIANRLEAAHGSNKDVAPGCTRTFVIGIAMYGAVRRMESAGGPGTGRKGPANARRRRRVGAGFVHCPG